MKSEKLDQTSEVLRQLKASELQIWQQLMLWGRYTLGPQDQDVNRNNLREDLHKTASVLTFQLNDI